MCRRPDDSVTSRLRAEFSLAPYRRLTTPQSRQQTATEASTGQHVDDKVDRQVEDCHGVADCRVEVMPAATLAQFTVYHRPEDVVDQRRSLNNQSIVVVFHLISGNVDENKLSYIYSNIVFLFVVDLLIRRPCRYYRPTSESDIQ